MTSPEQMASSTTSSVDAGGVIGRPPVPPATVEPAAPVAAPVESPATESEPSTATATVAAPAAAAAIAATAAPKAIPASLALARGIPDGGRQNPPGNSDEQTGPGTRPSGLSGRLTRLLIGSHTISRSALSQLRVSSYSAGLLLGADRNQQPVPVRLFRAQPTRVALVGGPWASQLVVFRSLALGARITVITTDINSWQGFGERATGRADRVTVLTAQRPWDWAASAQQPGLMIYDLGPAGATAPEPLGPWQTQITVLRQLEPSERALIQAADMVLLQRLGAEEARVAGPALRLPAQSVELLQGLSDDMIALVADGGDHYISLTPTALEREHTGVPRR